MSGAFDKSIFDGNPVLLKIGEEIDKHRFVYIGGDMICSFLTNDDFYEYISNMGENLAPYSIALREENICFLTQQFFIKREKIIDTELLKTKKVLLIHLVIMFQIVEKASLKNCDYMKLIQILIRIIVPILIQINLISPKWD